MFYLLIKFLFFFVLGGVLGRVPSSVAQRSEYQNIDGASAVVFTCLIKKRIGTTRRRPKSFKLFTFRYYSATRNSMLSESILDVDDLHVDYLN